ncbi:MAG: hypothetical protein PHQ57_00395 [Candidatus Omnitrophica bacterium]|nr:hypothetical protein [Candidatus Omnitrophota bacterium]
MKKVIIILVIAVLAIFAIGIIKDQIVKAVVTVVATQVTGAPVHIDGLSLGVFTSSVRISGFKMYNPRGFSKNILVDLSKINVKCDLGALLTGKIHLLEAGIELKEMGLEKDKEGKLNVDALKVAKPAKQMPMQIDILNLGIGKIIFRDYSVGQEPGIKVYDVNINKSYKNITSAQQLVALVLTEPMKAAGIQGAKIYGAAMLTGVAFLPVAIAATFAGRDSVQQDFNATSDKAYEVSLAVLKRMGKVTREDKAGGIIKADVNSVSVALRLNKKSANKTEVIVSARKYLFPKPEIAGGVLHEISQSLK